ncbi:4-hydroxybenzoate polyprenyltransferase [Granulibacter bethesdensis]|nr:4-hydroxybenzoate polyprenyltransferase [Granulibacter bethesdensis]
MEGARADEKRFEAVMTGHPATNPAHTAEKMTGPHTDLRPDGWIAHLPRRIQPYALLARLDRPVGIWLLFLPGVWGILAARPPDRESLRLIVLFLIGSAVMRSAGCVVNDMWDRDLDRSVARTAGRPLAAGLLGMRQAALFLGLLLLAGLLVLLQLPRMAQIAAASSLLLVAVYPLAKRVTWWPQLVMGFTFGFGAPAGAIAAGAETGPDWWLVGFLYAAAIFWDLGFDTIYGFQDIEDDAVIGVKSTSRRFVHMPRRFVGGSYALMVVFLILAGIRAGLPWLYDLALTLPAALLLWQVHRLDILNPAACLGAFRANTRIGLAVAGAFLWGWIGLLP